MKHNKPFDLNKSSGHLSLDFINTANLHGTESHQEWLESIDDVWTWAAFVGLSTSEQDNASPLEINELIQLRELMYRMTVCTILEAPVKIEDMDNFNQWFKKANEYLNLVQKEDGSFIQELKGMSGLMQVTAPVVIAFHELLLTEEIKKVKQCSRERCEWLFIDKTKNGSRQWCTMNICGNREKAKRYRSAKGNLKH